MFTNGVALIGLGNISDKYRTGLNVSKIFKLVALCDINDYNLKNNLYPKLPSYTDYTDLVKNRLNLNLNTVIIATPPATHYMIAKYFLENKINVILEKPATENLKELEELYKISEENKTKFIIMFHYIFGSEIVYLSKHIDEFKQKFGNIKSIKCFVNDPYCDNSKMHIKQDKIGMGGAWLDSGINCLSLIHKFIPINTLKPINISSKIDCSCNLPYYTLHSLSTIENTEVTITINWTEDINFKRAFIQFEDGTTMFINLTDQSIYIAKEIQEKKLLENIHKSLYDFHKNKNTNFSINIPQNNLIFLDFGNLNVEDKLHTHYYNLFTARNIEINNNISYASNNLTINNFEEFYENYLSKKETIILHKLLYKLNPKI